MILEKLGIYGWKERDENLLLASLLTGDPLLLIGTHGTAKTHTASRIAETIGKTFIAYDSSKALFEDVLGYPNIEKLKQGVVDYIPSKVTIWDKEMILIDELNRALPEMQNKWLEIIRSRRIMGFKTKVKWVWSAMNPLSYSATQALDEALIGRFSLFLYPPEVLQMGEEDRIKVTAHINGDDAPAISEWLEGKRPTTIQPQSIKETGEQIITLLKKAAVHFQGLKEKMLTISEFLAKFSDLLMRETKGQINLDGRRLGFIYRNILANRAIDLAKGEDIPDFARSARYVVLSSIPIGLNDESQKREEINHKIEVCFDLLSNYFQEGSQIKKLNLIYELFTTQDIMRKAELLLKMDLGELVKSKAWHDLMNNGEGLTTLAYVALQIEARKPGTVPQELLEALSGNINGANLQSSCIENLKGDDVEYIEDVEQLLQRDTDLALLISLNRARGLVRKGGITPERIKETEELIEKDLKIFEALINEKSREEVKVA